MNQIRKLGTRYEKVVEKTPQRISRHRPNNPAMGGVGDLEASPENIRRAEIADRFAERIKILMGGGRFDACIALVLEAQEEMAPKVFRPSSPIDEVLGVNIANAFGQMGCETLLHLAAYRESELRAMKSVHPWMVAVIQKALTSVGLAYRAEKAS